MRLPDWSGTDTIITKELTMAKNVAEIFVETLIAAGVKRIYGVVGIH